MAAEEQISPLIEKILLEGRPPYKEVDFPRLNAAGQPICRVRVELIEIGKERQALAQARINCANLMKETPDYKSDLNDLEHNERITEILALACRKVDNPEEPFFKYGVVEVRRFTSDELGVLALVYARLKEENPRVEEMSGKEVDRIVKILVNDLDQYPFSSWGRGALERFTERCVERLASVLPQDLQPGNGFSRWRFARRITRNKQLKWPRSLQ